jgi:cAMP-specific phosphodiesterase 4/calcium/calmodulin-dependent 3',5'-cyclic nucleotide phosphodiesterase
MSEPPVSPKAPVMDTHCDPVPFSCPIEPALDTKELCLLKPILTAASSDWEIDVLSLAELTNNRPLSTLSMHLFEHHGLISAFQLDRSKLVRFLMAIEHGYPEKNQYHNRAHAASVVHFFHSILSHGGVAQAAAIAAGANCEQDHKSKFIILAGLLAAVVHDYEHEGVNNDFLVKTSNKKAILYNDRSPNENHHVAAAWHVLQHPECNFLENMGVSDHRQLRRLVVEMVLGTDMAAHGNTLKSFKQCMEEKRRSAKASSSNDCLVLTSESDAILTLQLASKCADLGHLSLNWTSHLRWVRLLEEEFFAQGDREKVLAGLEVSFLMDRKKPGASDTQVGFFDFVVLPLFREFSSEFPGAVPMLSGVEANYAIWKNVQDELKASQ